MKAVVHSLQIQLPSVHHTRCGTRLALQFGLWLLSVQLDRVDQMGRVLMIYNFDIFYCVQFRYLLALLSVLLFLFHPVAHQSQLVLVVRVDQAFPAVQAVLDVP